MNFQNSNSVRLIALALVISIVAFLVWFARSLNPPPPPTPVAPTYTPTATVTPEPTATPTNTNTPEPTATPLPTETPTPAPQWRPVRAFRHNRMGDVLYWQPERYSPIEANGYIATIDCAELGRWYLLRKSPAGLVLRVKVIDCQNAEHADAHAALWGKQETIELDEINWTGLRLMNEHPPIVEIAPVP